MATETVMVSSDRKEQNLKKCDWNTTDSICDHDPLKVWHESLGGSKKGKDGKKGKKGQSFCLFCHLCPFCFPCFIDSITHYSSADITPIFRVDFPANHRQLSSLTCG